MGQVQVSKDGQPVILPWEDATGKQLKEHLSIAPDRIPTVVEDGVTRGVADHETVSLRSGSYISDAPRFRYGGSLPVEVIMSEEDHRSLCEHLNHNPELEQHAFLLASLCESERGRRLLVREMAFARPGDFIRQTATYLDLQPSYYLPMIDRCRNERLHLIEAHSHPFVDRGVRFSAVDIGNEMEKFPWYAEKTPDMEPATLVFGARSVDGHWWDKASSSIRPVSSLRVVGPTLQTYPTTSAIDLAPQDKPQTDMYHRQVLAFGAPGQALISRTRVGIVGCGGLGSVVAEQLSHLGIRDFVLVDEDTVEITNLNRLVFALPEDASARRPKVEVIARGIRAVQPGAQIDAVCGSIVDPTAQERLKDVDVLVAGVDSDGARLVCNQLSVRYLLPYLDLGTGLTVRDGRVTEAGGQMWYVHPGGFCLTCTGAIDPYAARVGLMDEVERNRHVERGYGSNVPQPSVIFLNTALASLAVGELVKLVTGYQAPQSMVFFDALKPSVQPFVPPARNPNCPVCHRGALYGRGDESPTTSFHKPLPIALPAMHTADSLSHSGSAGEPGSGIIRV